VSTFFENNLFLFLAAMAIAIAAWMACSQIADIRFRRAAKASIVFLAFPIVYLGHSFLFYQSWMLLVIYIAQLSVVSLILYFVVWASFIGISQIKIVK